MPRGITEKTKERKWLIYEWAEQEHPVTVARILSEKDILTCKCTTNF